MRRPHSDHEGIFADEDTLLLWKCDEASTTTGLLDSSYSALFTLVSAGSHVQSVQPGLFTAATPGSRMPGGVGATAVGWWQGASASSAHAYVGTNWSFSMWVQKGEQPVTRALIEHAADETPTVDGDLSGLGCYWLADGQLRLQWDISTSSVAHFCDFNLGFNSAASGSMHLGVVKQQHTSSAEYVNVSVYKNGELAAATQMLRTVHTAANSRGVNARWIVAGSRRWGTTSGASPAFVYGVGSKTWWDDIGFWKIALPAAKMREIYRNGIRNWDERRLLEANSHKIRSRVWIEDGDGVLQNLTALWENNWVQSVDVKESVSEPASKATVVINRIRGQTLNLSPLAEDSNLNLNAAGSFEPLIELRRRIVIERAVVPAEHNIQGWEWEPEFDGYIEAVSTNRDSVTIECLDKIAPLKDTFQLDPRAYDYYSAPAIAETHLQTVIANNVPRLLGSTTLTFGYLGGTPLLYTPASSGWLLNYDDTPSGNVDSILQSIADQIGWDLRYRWDDKQQQHRLTFSQPNREKQIDILSITEDLEGTGKCFVTTRVPHGLIEGQRIDIDSGIVGGSNQIVSEVLSYNRFRLGFDTPGAGTEDPSTAKITYTPLLPIESRLINSLDDVKKDTQNIRNAAVVKYQRVPQTFTLPIRSIAGGSGSQLTLLFTPSYALTLDQLNVGDSFTITDCPDADANVTATIGSKDYSVGEVRIVTQQTLAATVTTSSGIFKSEYLRHKTAISVNTPSIAKYGLRQAAVYEATTGNIDTEAEAQKLADRIVSDLANPTADVTLKMSCWPDFELHDLIALAPDARRRWTTTQTFAIVDKTLHIEGERSYLSLGLRNDTPSLGTAWVTRIRQDGFTKPGLADDNIEEELLDTVGSRFGGNLGRIFSSNIPPTHVRGYGARRRLRNNFYELHLSTTCDAFQPTQDTLVWAGQGSQPQIHMTPDGTPLMPGTTYYVRLRHVDIFGNKTQASTGTAIVVRWLDKPPSAKVWLDSPAATGASLQFVSNNWCAYPFDTSSTPGFDSSSLFNLGSSSPATLSLLTDPPASTASYFRMPCDGDCMIQARIGVRAGNTSKTDVPVMFGFMRIGSVVQGANASVPVVIFRHVVNANSPTLLPTTQFVGATANGSSSALFVNLSGHVTANSGDYVAIGVMVDPGNNNTTGVHATSGTVPNSATVSWAKFTVYAQD